MDPVAGSSTTPLLPRLSGSVPGLLDPSQRSRLLRGSNGALIFATHDARAASAHFDVEDVRKLDINDTSLRPKRIVVEISSSGHCRWRFVPKARLEEGVVDEGTWPRAVNICGELYEFSHDQWDIHKLDPEYDCYVPAPPEIPIITRKPPIREPTALPPTPEKQNGKRKPSPSSERLSKRAFVDDAGSSSEDENEMVIDDPPPRRSRSASIGVKNPRAQRMREMIQERKARKEKTDRRAEKLSNFNNSIDIPAPTTPSPERSTTAPPSDSKTKRKVDFLYNPIRATRDDPDYTEPLEEDRNAYNYAANANSKRTRTVSPVAAKRTLEIKRQEREKVKRERREAELEERRRAMHQQFMESVMADVQHTPHVNGTNHEHGHREQDKAEDHGCEDSIDDEDVARLASIEESRRKLAELEADRPLWAEAAKRKQQEQEQAEEERRLAEARRQAAEAKRAEEEQKAKAQRAAEERKREEVLRRQREEAAARRERERRQRQQRWSAGPWTVQRALERCKAVSDAFDETKYSPSFPLAFEDIPWPVLHPPMSFRAEDIEWHDVEKFFHQVKLHMKPQDYKPFVVKCHRRFHPDRWRSRGLLNSIEDETDRNCLEVAANTVAQALTPLWRELR